MFRIVMRITERHDKLGSFYRWQKRQIMQRKLDERRRILTCGCSLTSLFVILGGFSICVTIRGQIEPATDQNHSFISV